MKKIMMSTLVASSLAIAGGDIVPVEPMVETPVVEDTSAWQQELTIYGWLAGVSAETRLPGDTGDTTVDVEDILDSLKMVFMGSYAARYDKWSFILDATYIDLGDSATKTLTLPNQTVDASISVDMKSLIVNTGIGYNIVNSENTVLDVVAGVRYLDLELDVDTTLASHPGISGSKDFLDGIIGLRGSYNIDENWYLPYYADIGTGDSDLTYQAFAGVGYRYDWGDIKFGYRYVGYEMEDDMLVENLDLSGAILGASIKF